MVSRSAAKELTLKTNRNSEDITALYELLDKTDKKVDHLTTEVSGIRADLGNLDSRVESLDSKFEARFDQVNGRFDQLEQLLAPLTAESGAHHGGSTLRTPLEKKLSSLDEEIDTYSRRTFKNTQELERHNRIFDAHDERFDHLDSQMAEVLGILRSKAG